MRKLSLLFLILATPFFALSQDIRSSQINNSPSVYMVPIAVGMLGASLTAAHIAAPEDYSWKTNTISDLASQGYDNAWIARTGFISFGSLIATAATLDLINGRGHWEQNAPLAIYGASVALSGVYRAEPFQKGVAYSESEAKLHTIFANVAGIAFVGAMLGTALTETNPQRRIFHYSSMAVVTLCSAMFMLQPQNQGVWQRLLWASSLTWLTVSYSF